MKRKLDEGTVPNPPKPINAPPDSVRGRARGSSPTKFEFRLDLDGGKPAKGQTGIQPEWFYKGDGSCVVAPEQPLPMPAFAEDGGEEAELALDELEPGETTLRLVLPAA